jgi:hypothetical protein
MEEYKEESYLGVIISGVIIFILVVYIGYIYSYKDILTKGELKKSYIKKSDLEFYSLPQDIQDQYLPKYECNSKVQFQEKIVIKEVIDSKTCSKDGKVTDEYKVFRCYDMSSGDIYLSEQCKDDLKVFLENNKNSNYFEIIGIVNDEDFALLNSLKNSSNKTSIDKIANYAQLGLSKKRVMEGNWEIKKYLGHNTDVRGVNYSITSQAGNKGIVIRAYK